MFTTKKLSGSRVVSFVQLQDSSGRTPLLAALHAGQRQAARHVLTKFPLHVGLTRKDIHGCSIWHYAHQFEQIDLYQVCALFRQVEDEAQDTDRTQPEGGKANEVEPVCSQPTGLTPVRRLAHQLARRHQKRSVILSKSSSTTENATSKRQDTFKVKESPPFAFHQDKLISDHSMSPVFVVVARNDLATLKFLWKCNDLWKCKAVFENNDNDARNILEFAVDCLKPKVVSFLLADGGMRSEDDKMCLMHRCGSALAWTEAEMKAQFEILNMLHASQGQPIWTCQGHDSCRPDVYSQERDKCMQRMFSVLANNWSGETRVVKDIIAGLVRTDQIEVLNQAIIEGHSAMVEWWLSCIHSTESTLAPVMTGEDQLYLACTAKRKVVKIMEHILQHWPRVLDGDQRKHVVDSTEATEETSQEDQITTVETEREGPEEIVAKRAESNAADNEMQDTTVDETDDKCTFLYSHTPLEWLMHPALPRSPEEDNEFHDRENLGCFLVENKLYLDIVCVDDDTGDSIHAACVALSLAVKQHYWKIAESLLQNGAAEIFWNCVHGEKKGTTLCTECYKLSAQGMIRDLCRPNAPIKLLQTFLSLKPKDARTPQSDAPVRSPPGYWVPSLNPAQLCELVELSRTYPRLCPHVCCEEFTYAPRGGTIYEREPTKNWTVLHEACRTGNEDIVTRLLGTLHEVLQMPNEPSLSTPLSLAVRSESVVNVETLLARGAPPSWAIVAESFDRQRQSQRQSPFCRSNYALTVTYMSIATVKT